ncbi:hypothetical protein ACNFJ7_10885 [Sphingomonas sp. HT-1]|uniref:hypothetical protein n=1 Tax=unclassified Sphingomonas TaxID=196159 RepID=UPI0002DA9F1C|nr:MULTISPECIES: hypothetical protein [unclassified Sphingomonas]KTF70337.1 hypothetical protein ATB93_04780 [Sphingomonas sp. WG]
MTEPSADVPQSLPAKPTRQGPFRRKFTAVRLAPESAERQSRVALLAWNVLGGEQAMAFLNAHDEALGGRPLDLAVASADGCAAVERAIAARAPAG